MPATFRDPNLAPTTEMIHAVLGASAEVWDALTEIVTDAGGMLVWRHYTDGGWLAKASKAGKTVAWLNVAPGQATVTFYFAERHRAPLIENPALSPALRGQIAGTPLSGKLLPVTLTLLDERQLPAARALLTAKLGLK